jgi:hypothetical protein
VDWELNWGLRCVPTSTLQLLGCHPCACKLFLYQFPFELITQRSVVQIHPQQPFTNFSVPIGSRSLPR